MNYIVEYNIKVPEHIRTKHYAHGNHYIVWPTTGTDLELLAVRLLEIGAADPFINDTFVVCHDIPYFWEDVAGDMIDNITKIAI